MLVYLFLYLFFFNILQNYKTDLHADGCENHQNFPVKAYKFQKSVILINSGP